jgi:hypothetical protein
MLQKHLKLVKIGLGRYEDRPIKKYMIYNCLDLGSSTQCTSEASTSPIYIMGFSMDGLMTNMLLLIIFILLFTKFIYETFIGTKQKPKHYE